MDDKLSTNDFKNTCLKCKDCAFQNQSHYFKVRCKIYIHHKPETVLLNGDCEFYVKSKSERDDL